jgi:hypothetical protein
VHRALADGFVRQCARATFVVVLVDLDAAATAEPQPPWLTRTLPVGSDASLIAPPAQLLKRRCLRRLMQSVRVGGVLILNVLLSFSKDGAAHARRSAETLRRSLLNRVAASLPHCVVGSLRSPILSRDHTLVLVRKRKRFLRSRFRARNVGVIWQSGCNVASSRGP